MKYEVKKLIKDGKTVPFDPKIHLEDLPEEDRGYAYISGNTVEITPVDENGEKSKPFYRVFLEESRLPALGTNAPIWNISYCYVENLRRPKSWESAEIGQIQAVGAFFAGAFIFEGVSFAGIKVPNEGVNAGSNFTHAKFAGDACLPVTEYGEGIGLSSAKLGNIISFAKVNCGASICFDGAEFVREVDFKSANFLGVSFDRAKFIGGVCFEKVGFNRDIDFKRAEFFEEANFFDAGFAGDACFERAKFVRKVDFKFARFATALFTIAEFVGGACFEKVTFNRDTDFAAAEFGGGSSFKNATFGGDVFFAEVVSDESIDLTEATFSGSAEFTEATFGGSVVFKSAVFNKNASLKSTTFSVDVDFSSATFGDSVSFDFAKFKSKVHFAETNFLGDVVSFGVLSSIQNKETDDNEYTEFCGDVDFPHAAFKGRIVNFDRVIFGGKVNFFFTKFEDNIELTFSRVRPKEGGPPKANISFADVNFLGKLSIAEAELASLKLLRSTFSQPVNLHGSKFDEIGLKETHFEKNVILPEPKDIGDYQDRRTANILKHQALIQNDKIVALAYHCREKKKHRQKLKWGKNFTEKVPNVFDCITNGYGAWWWLALLWILFGGTALFWLYLDVGSWTDKEGVVSVVVRDPEGVGWFFRNLFVFLYPFPSQEFLGLGKPSGEALGIFYLSRVFLAALYYQLIQAFRRNKRF